MIHNVRHFGKKKVNVILDGDLGGYLGGETSGPGYNESIDDYEAVVQIGEDANGKPRYYTMCKTVEAKVGDLVIVQTYASSYKNTASARIYLNGELVEYTGGGQWTNQYAFTLTGDCKITFEYSGRSKFYTASIVMPYTG